MQIPSTQPYLPPFRLTKPSNSDATARSQESSSTDESAESDPVSSDLFTASAYEPIQQAMNNLPDSRANVVARGKALAANPDYPALQIISTLANLFIDDAQTSLVGDN